MVRAGLFFKDLDGEGLAERAGDRLTALGYRSVALLEGGLTGWRAGGGELFRDVNVPSKAFGELVEARRHTPSIPAEQLKQLLDTGADLVVLDARRFEEYEVPSGTIAGETISPKLRERRFHTASALCGRSPITIQARPGPQA